MSTTLLLALFFSSLSRADGPLELPAFLAQVREKHQGVQAATETAAGALGHAGDSRLPLKPYAFASAQLQSDGRLPQLPLFSYDRIVTNAYSLGVGENTSFGLQAKVSYNLLYTSYVNTVIPGQPNVSGLAWHDATPRIELTQSLWSNGFGRATRATADFSEAQALATTYGARFQGRALLADAEITYWRLAVARQAVEVTREALERAKRIQSWNGRRARLGLGDQSDALQSDALAEQRKLELQSALDEERAARRAFNSARSLDSDSVPEALANPSPATVAELPAPTRAELRDDVKAAREQERAARAGGEAAIEHDLPTLDVFGAYTLNGRAAPVGDALSDPFSAGRPTEMIGVRFQTSLDVGGAADARRGWAREQAGAELSYQRKLFEQEQSWKDLTDRLDEGRRRLVLAQSIEKAQGTKLHYERGRLEKGRSTTYQVLLFEQDFAQAQLGRIRAEAEVLNLLAQMKLFGDAT